MEDDYPTEVESLTDSIQNFTVYSLYSNSWTNPYPTTISNNPHPTLQIRYQELPIREDVSSSSSYLEDVTVMTSSASIAITNAVVDRPTTETDALPKLSDIICLETMVRVWLSWTVLARHVE